MISVIIPTLNAEKTLTATLASLIPALLEGLVREVIIVDGGSCDATLRIADEAGTQMISAARGRGLQLAAGARAAKGPWLLFLHADTRLDRNWEVEAARFIDDYRQGEGRAAAFRFALDDEGFKPRLLEALVWLRCRLLALPYGDQGLLIGKSAYQQLGGHRELPLMEDVDLIRRIGRTRLHLLRSRALTSAERYRREGYWRRSARNLTCLTLYYLGVAPEKILARYE